MTHQPYIEEERLQELLAEYPACSAELELVAGCWFPVNWMFLQSRPLLSVKRPE